MIAHVASLTRKTMKGVIVQHWFILGILFLVLIGGGYVYVSPVESQSTVAQPRFEYRVIEVPPDTRSIQTALDEYGHRGWELVAFEMGELQTPRMIFKKGTILVP